MVITDNIDFSAAAAANQSHKSGGFADIKPGVYKGHIVAVKTLRVAMSDDFGKIRKVGRKGGVPRSDGMILRSLHSNSAKKLSFGIRCPTQTS